MGLHFATDGYTPVRRGPAGIFWPGDISRAKRYFADFAPVIRQELRAKQAPAGPWADKIRAAAWPVALHLRRGDYCKPENEILQVCTPAYYARAAAAAAAAHPEATVFVLSDDIPWARRKTWIPPVCLRCSCPGGRSGGHEPDGPVPGFYPEAIPPTAGGPSIWPTPERTVWAPDRWYAHTKHTALYQPDWQRIRTQ